MPAHSRPKDGIASLAYIAGIHAFSSPHKTWMAGPSPAMMGPLPMKARYIRAMDALNTACLFVAGCCLVIITLIVPYGVFTRYVLNSAASWPEPMAILLMIVLSFLSAVVCYREYLHIGVGVLPM